MIYERTISATWEPVTTEEARTHCRLVATDGSHPDDDYLDSLIKAAREKVEHDSKLCVLASSFLGYVDDFPPGKIIIQQSPVIAVSKIEYYKNAAWQELSSDSYEVDTISRPARIYPIDAWPGVDDGINKVRISFSSGYPSQSDIPQKIKEAVLLLVGHWYEVRQPVVTGISVSEVPVTYDNLIEIMEVKYF